MSRSRSRSWSTIPTLNHGITHRWRRRRRRGKATLANLALPCWIRTRCGSWCTAPRSTSSTSSRWGSCRSLSVSANKWVVLVFFITPSPSLLLYQVTSIVGHIYSLLDSTSIPRTKINEMIHVWLLPIASYQKGKEHFIQATSCRSFFESTGGRQRTFDALVLDCDVLSTILDWLRLHKTYYVPT